MNDCNFLASCNLKDVILSIDDKETSIAQRISRVLINTSIATNARNNNEIEIIIEEFQDNKFTCASFFLMEHSSLLLVSDCELIMLADDFKLIFSDINSLSSQQLFNAGDEPLVNKIIIKATHFSKQPHTT